MTDTHSTFRAYVFAANRATRAFGILFGIFALARMAGAPAWVAISPSFVLTGMWYWFAAYGVRWILEVNRLAPRDEKGEPIQRRADSPIKRLYRVTYILWLSATMVERVSALCEACTDFAVDHGLVLIGSWLGDHAQALSPGSQHRSAEQELELEIERTRLRITRRAKHLAEDIRNLSVATMMDVLYEARSASEVRELAREWELRMLDLAMNAGDPNSYYPLPPSTRQYLTGGAVAVATLLSIVVGAVQLTAAGWDVPDVATLIALLAAGWSLFGGVQRRWFSQRRRSRQRRR